MDQEDFASEIGRQESARSEACRILGVAADGDARALKKAYRKACLENHPDRNPNDADARRRFLLLQCAYEMLTKGTVCKLLLEKLKTESPAPPRTPYNLHNAWGMFLWWREQFGDVL